MDLGWDYRGHIEEYCIESKVFIRVRNGQGWIQLKLKEEYMTLPGRLQDYSLPHNSKVKSHFKFIKLDINVHYKHYFVWLKRSKGICLVCITYYHSFIKLGK